MSTSWATRPDAGFCKREPYPFDVAAVIDAAVARGVALEINCQVDRLDLSDVHARLARDRGARLVISSDAHSRAAVGALRWGVWWPGARGSSRCTSSTRGRSTSFESSLRRNRLA